jgi:hypothetical protein
LHSYELKKNSNQLPFSLSLFSLIKQMIVLCCLLVVIWMGAFGSAQHKLEQLVLHFKPKPKKMKREKSSNRLLVSGVVTNDDHLPKVGAREAAD